MMALPTIAIVFLLVGAVSTLVTAGHRQHMWIMNLVWPITALYAGPFALLAYYKVGRLSTHHAILVQASKADFLSLTAWQVGMYGWMAIRDLRDLPP